MINLNFEKLVRPVVFVIFIIFFIVLCIFSIKEKTFEEDIKEMGMVEIDSNALVPFKEFYGDVNFDSLPKCFSHFEGIFWEDLVYHSQDEMDVILVDSLTGFIHTIGWRGEKLFRDRKGKVHLISEDKKFLTPECGVEWIYIQKEIVYSCGLNMNYYSLNEIPDTISLEKRLYALNWKYERDL